jgi:RNA polymerase sigma-70 factor (ECF subfamily)
VGATLIITTSLFQLTATTPDSRFQKAFRFHLFLSPPTEKCCVEGCVLVENDQSVNLMARWQAGDQQAASELFHRYADRLIALARSRLSPRLSQRVDPEDVVQSAYRSFFAGAREGQYDLERGGDLWQLLVVITLHKLHDQVRRHTSDKRSVEAEQNFGSEDSLLSLQAQLLSHTPSPVEALTLADLVQQVMRGLEPVERRMLRMRLQGHTLEEIAAETRLSRRSVRRVLERVKEQLEQWESL